MVVLDDFQGRPRLFVRVGAQGSFDCFQLLLAPFQIDDLALDLPRSSVAISIDSVWRVHGERKAWRFVERLRLWFAAGDERLEALGQMVRARNGERIACLKRRRQGECSPKA